MQHKTTEVDISLSSEFLARLMESDHAVPCQYQSVNEFSPEPYVASSHFPILYI